MKCASSERFLRTLVAVATEKYVSFGDNREGGVKLQQGAKRVLPQLPLLEGLQKSETDAGLGRVALTASLQC